MTDRSRREIKSKLDKFAEYKRAREGGGRVLKEEDTELYDEVTEDQYKSIVKGRLQRDDFVVDDGAEGYVDNGMDDWTGGDEETHDSEEEEDTRIKKKKPAPKAKSKPKPKPPPPAAPSINAYRPAVSAAQEEDFMSNILGEIDAMPIDPLPSKSSRKRKPSPTYDSDSEPSPKRPDYSSYRTKQNYTDLSSDGPYPGDDVHFTNDEAHFASPTKRMRVDDATLAPAAEKLAGLEVYSSASDADTSYDDIDMDAFMDVDDDDFDMKPSMKKEDVEPVLPKKSIPLASSSTTKKKEEPDAKPNWYSVYDSLAVETEDTLGPLSSNSTSSSNIKDTSILEPDGSLCFFWLDYLELDGKLYFTGKLKDKATDTWISCCITVEGMKRNLFVLPREKQTDVVPDEESVDADFDMIRKQLKIKTIGANSEGESRWMKVIYGFNEPVVPMNAESQNIAMILGTNTSAFELLVLKRKIMGPCWITIKNPLIENKGVSWCKVEATVSNPKDFNPEQPPLNVMSLSVRTIVNHQENKREIVCASARIWHNMQTEDATPPEKLKCTVLTFIRPLDRFPTGFEQQAKNNAKGTIMPMKNERMLLNSLLVTIYKADPDIIVGHEFLGVSLDVLLNRMRDLKADHWSRLGRFRRSRWPTIGKQGTNIRFLNGRLLCDLASDGAKSMISSTTWSLTEMEDYDPDDAASKLDGSLVSPEPMLKYTRHCELDAHLVMAIASKVQILPLTKQLTGNKTLNGGRAERNEYILLHEFHRLKYICPDKTFGKKSVHVKEEPEADDEDDAAGGGGGNGGKKGGAKPKRDKYKGGLVFEPKRGLWDKFILVMDFNSLYPSIIQEYNIDFTTVEPVEDDENGDEQIPEPPLAEVGQGILPRLIATLVSRRRQVKSLMKDRTAAQAQLLQWDIKQQALKLTANSMYGCLGFEYSRFYARPLAALTTFKGREILTHTRELAESLNLDVVYGDTDSVFVNSNVTEFSEALKISSMFKKAVNDRYKLLEIDLDGVFQRLLLLQKKKYAAVKVDDGTKTSIEVKGLDMKRREYCNLSKNASGYVLDQILSGEATENVVENIHDYLTTLGEEVRTGKRPLDEFIIFKRLGKNPEDYPDAKSQPHVQVALRMKQRGGSARTGDVIPYIFCLDEGEESSKTGQADRAKHPDEYRKAGGTLTIDYQYYLSHQVLPPVERLCEPIEGTERARLAECLGLDPTHYRHSVGGTEQIFSALDSQISDTERFRDATPFIVRCRYCHTQFPFLHIHEQEPAFLLPTGPTCPSCSKTISSGSLQTQLEVQIRDCIARYYEGWTVCNDQTCHNRTRMMGVYGKRCLRADCKGRYTDTQLYNQLRFFASLFDIQKTVESAKNPKLQESVKAITAKNHDLLKDLAGCVDRHLNNCGRRWIDLGSIFSTMKI
ncbi:DNA polymerase alpha catalytic subunit [Gymnopilus junonius]|uniref:DNA polymerase n=1 Tax=Gymnopilus junonius TaxID=109634 RepID=A0A9P5NHM8_GYMJU|nr:DNA polymerase alpha catalytic subunit [Gymnopilus junonius]